MVRSLLVVVLLAFATAPAWAQVEGLGYRLAPAGTYVFFDNDAALQDGLLYGGSGGLSFGEFLELNGSYLFGSGFETEVANLSGAESDPALAAALAALAARSVDLERYGADVKLNLGTGAVVPFLTGGTGIIRFSPDGGDPSRSLYLLGGAGLQVSLADRFGLSVAAEAFGYRYNPATALFTDSDLAGLGLGVEDFNNVEVLNPSLRAALSVYLGGRRPGELSALDREFQRQFSGGLSGLSLVLEPFYARTEFDDAFNYSDQTFVGGEIGVDLGPLVGVRGFYGRGVDSDDPTDFQDIQMVGGDLRLRLNAGDGLTPFLTVGAGYLDVLDGYGETVDAAAETNRALAESRPFALGGLGIEVPFGRRLRAVGEVRALAMSAQPEGDVSQPDDVYFSPTYRAGLSVGLGGSAGRRTEVVRASDLVEERARLQAEIADQQALAAEREGRLQLAIDRARFEGDSLAVVRLRAEQIALQASTGQRSAALQTSAPETPAPQAPAVGGDGVAAALPTPIRTTRGERIVTIPLPETGELYVRYGEPGGVSIGSAGDGAEAGGVAPGERLSPDEVRAIVRETVREAMSQDGVADAAEIERRVEDRIADRLAGQMGDRSASRDLESVERRLESRIASEMAQLRALIEAQQLSPQQVQPPDRVYVPPTAPAVPPVAAPSGVVVEAPNETFVATTLPETPRRLRERGLYAFSPTLGVGVGESSNLFAGIRGEYASGGVLTYVPEILVGVTGRRAFAANLDATVGFPVAAVSEYGLPYGRIGLGVVSTGGSDAVPDTFDEDLDDGSTSLTFNLGLGADLTYGGGRFFVDFTTGNLGTYNRLTAGYRFPFGGRVY